MDELERLVSELAACEMPYTCPHGRPTLVFMGRSEIRRKFGRS
jgi:DNA mismatch repair protein MutL